MISSCNTTSSDRHFGFVFCGVFLIVFGVVWWQTPEGPPPYWALGLAAGVLIVSLIAPGLLAPLNRAWMKFGDLLHRIVSPLVMGIIFFAVITPTGLILRIIGKDVLGLKRQPGETTYWVDRDAGEQNSMTQQF